MTNPWHRIRRGPGMAAQVEYDIARHVIVVNGKDKPHGAKGG